MPAPRAGSSWAVARRDLPLWAVGVVVAAACLLPPVYLVLRALELEPGAIESLLRADTLTALLLRTLGLSLAVAATSTLFAVPLAWATTGRRLPAEGLWVTLTAAPLAIPSYVGAYLWIGSVGPGGLLTRALRDSGIELDLPYDGFVGAWLVLSLLCYPYVYLPVRAALARTPRSLEEAARTLGRSRRRAFVEVTLPQLAPSMGAGALLVALYVLSDFGAVSLLRCKTFTEVIYSRYQTDWSGAAALALGLVALAALLVVGERLLRPTTSLHVRRGAAVEADAATGRSRAAWAVVVPFLLVALVLPLTVLGVWLSRARVDGSVLSRTFELTGASVYASGLAAVAASLLALPVAYLAVRRPGRASTVLDRVTYAGFALPGVVIAIALVFFSLRIDSVVPLYQTLAVLVFAYVVHFLPQAVGAARSALQQVDPSLEEAARVLGRTPLRAFVSVTLPLLAPGVAAGAMLVFLTAMKELPATLLLAPTGFQTLATDVWQFTDEAQFARAAVPALFLLAFAAAPLLVLTRLLGRGGDR